MNLLNYIRDVGFEDEISKKLEAEYATQHPPTDDLPGIRIETLVVTNAVAVFRACAPLPGRQDWQAVLSVVLDKDGDSLNFCLETTHN